MTDTTYAGQHIRKRSQQEHYRDVLREGFKRKIEHLTKDCEDAQRYCRDLIRCGADVTEELQVLEQNRRGLELVTLLLKREAEKAAETAPFWTQDVAAE